MVNPEPTQEAVVAEEWDVEHVVIFRPEGGGRHRIQLLRLDADVLRIAREGNDEQRRPIYMVVGRAFQVRPMRLRWNQLIIFPSP